MDVARRHDRLGLVTPRFLGVQATLNSALAITDDFAVGSAHSKCSFWFVVLILAIAIKPRFYGHFEFFSAIFSSHRAY
jgi:hypothetical protein